MAATEDDVDSLKDMILNLENEIAKKERDIDEAHACIQSLRDVIFEIEHAAKEALRVY